MKPKRNRKLRTAKETAWRKFAPKRPTFLEVKAVVVEPPQFRLGSITAPSNAASDVLSGDGVH